MKGIISLDIDGTVTDTHVISPDIVSYLHKQVIEGWQIVFITGRTFHWAYQTLEGLPFPYYFAAYNGAIILEMPKKKVVSSKYLDKEILSLMGEVCSKEPTDVVIYAGYEHNDTCYYRPHYFSKELHDYLMIRKKAREEVWYEIHSFASIPLQSFPSIKCFGKPSYLKKIAEQMEEYLGLHIPVIRDPFNPRYFIAQATHPQVSKGYALRDVIQLIGRRGTVIAAGDDYNDMSMFEEADIKIAMATAPEDLLKQADIIAPSAAEKGILNGLKQAIQRVTE